MKNFTAISFAFLLGVIWKRIISITTILLFASLTLLQAQEPYIYKNDTLNIGVNLVLPAGIKKYQEVIELKGKKSIQSIHTPDSISEFYADRKVFVSMPSPIPGEDKKVFLHQLVKRDSIAVYQYENKSGSYLFFCHGKGELQEITAQHNPYAAFVAEEYVNDNASPVHLYQIKPTHRSIKFAEKLIETQNRNLLVRIRYGIWAGGGISTISRSVLPADNTDSHWFGGLFINIPIHYSFSLHSEISYLQEAYSYHRSNAGTLNDKVFNRKSIFMPVMLRYSFNHVKGNLVPYLQAGPSIHFALKQKEESQTIHINDENVTIEKSPPLEKKNILYPGLNAGAGLEYKLTSRHSLFLDIRYMHTLVSENNNLFYATLSMNF